jgi:hypothetical protein
MNEIEFRNYIESIGFKYNSGLYEYNVFLIDMWDNHYSFYNGSDWINYLPYNYLTQEVLKLTRSIKLKQLLK